MISIIGLHSQGTILATRDSILVGAISDIEAAASLQATNAGSHFKMTTGTDTTLVYYDENGAASLQAGDGNLIGAIGKRLRNDLAVVIDVHRGLSFVSTLPNGVKFVVLNSDLSAEEPVAYVKTSDTGYDLIGRGVLHQLHGSAVHLDGDNLGGALVGHNDLVTSLGITRI